MAFAAAWKAWKVNWPDEGALIEPTMPRPQWVTCLQWNQMAIVAFREKRGNNYPGNIVRWLSSVMLIVNWTPPTSPESKPAGELFVDARAVHGLSKEDWVTEWLNTPLLRVTTSDSRSLDGERTYFGNQNVTVVPLGAVMLDGWNVKPPLKPTSIYFPVRSRYGL